MNHRSSKLGWKRTVDASQKRGRRQFAAPDRYGSLWGALCEVVRRVGDLWKHADSLRDEVSWSRKTTLCGSLSNLSRRTPETARWRLIKRIGESRTTHTKVARREGVVRGLLLRGHSLARASRDSRVPREDVTVRESLAPCATRGGGCSFGKQSTFRKPPPFDEASTRLLRAAPPSRRYGVQQTGIRSRILRLVFRSGSRRGARGSRGYVWRVFWGARVDTSRVRFGTYRIVPESDT